MRKVSTGQGRGLSPGRTAPSLRLRADFGRLSQRFFEGARKKRAVEKVVRGERGAEFGQVIESAARINFKSCHSFAMQYDIMVL